MILIFTCNSTFSLVCRISNSCLNLLFSSYLHRISTVVWCSYSSWCMMHGFRSKLFLPYVQRDFNVLLQTILTLYFDYAQKFWIFSIVVLTRPQTTANISSFNVSNAFQTSVYINSIP